MILDRFKADLVLSSLVTKLLHPSLKTPSETLSTCTTILQAKLHNPKSLQCNPAVTAASETERGHRTYFKFSTAACHIFRGGQPSLRNRCAVQISTGPTIHKLHVMREDPRVIGVTSFSNDPYNLRNPAFSSENPWNSNPSYANSAIPSIKTC